MAGNKASHTGPAGFLGVQGYIMAAFQFINSVGVQQVGEFLSRVHVRGDAEVAEVCAQIDEYLHHGRMAQVWIDAAISKTGRCEALRVSPAGIGNIDA